MLPPFLVFISEKGDISCFRWEICSNSEKNLEFALRPYDEQIRQLFHRKSVLFIVEVALFRLRPIIEFIV